MTRGLLYCILLAALIGCAAPRDSLPTFARMDEARSLQTIAERAEKTKSVTAEGLITLRDAEGQTVRLDCVIVMRLPDELRMRAWKFGQAVFDLTLTPQGAWLIAPEDPDAPRHRADCRRRRCQARPHLGRACRRFLR